MAGVTTPLVRSLCESLGAGLTLCEFVSSEALAGAAPRALRRIRGTGGPLAVQIFGRDPDQMADAARRVCDEGAVLVDINMGCPAKRVVGGLAGVALMEEPALAARIVQRVRRAVPHRIPVSVKHRAGDRATRRNAPSFARRMAEAGAALITVHGRTRAQGFRGHSDRAIIAETCATVQVPVVGNGDVAGVDDALSMMEETGCAGVMIGRAGARDPWLFRRLRQVWRGEADPGPADATTRWNIVRQAVELGGALEDPTSPRQVAQLACGQALGLAGAREFRREVAPLRSLEAIAARAEAFFGAPDLRSQTPRSDPAKRCYAAGSPG